MYLMNSSSGYIYKLLYISYIIIRVVVYLCWVIIVWL